MGTDIKSDKISDNYDNFIFLIISELQYKIICAQFEYLK